MACGAAPAAVAAVDAPAAVPTLTSDSDDGLTDEPVAVSPKPSSAVPEPAVPDAVEPPYPLDEVTTVNIPMDRKAFVVHGNPGDHRVLLYLHGVCGNPTAFETWVSSIRPHGTLISLQGDKPCKGGYRTKWTHDIAGIARRLTAAIEQVEALRGEPLERTPITVLGYSQGALRAESLVKHFPERFPRAVLMGGPHTPAASSLKGAEAVLVMAGERDRQAHLREALNPLRAVVSRVSFMEIPKARHGEYGPEAEQTMADALSWIQD